MLNVFVCAFLSFLLHRITLRHRSRPEWGDRHQRTADWKQGWSDFFSFFLFFTLFDSSRRCRLLVSTPSSLSSSPITVYSNCFQFVYHKGKYANGNSELGAVSRTMLEADLGASPHTLRFFVGDKKQPVFILHIPQSIALAVSPRSCRVGHPFAATLCTWTRQKFHVLHL
jgi:hypothetical protein